ncbi:MAG: UDP-4-amino-4-deoxy-L-arabinose--oxoglutarate aminotransferase [candidate division TA06 bacterium ADurb.Bin417]|uniref:UDP-4-amino-4-deoxy-L-arabinose--oxoglutarate aminotransferase n=1 Tax=candidate division TA06 bacterium ADurb.Bin417 TaxID=1852828 RepID=A0A1V5MCC3_UNCT6|nr:MAG: UDP-4-amino-4-deoxy-L-arabinose--oxoglutarate aminotransferase [candidate division TA06 bacterium ADurb.Bin417]
MAVSSGTAALHLSLLACGIGPGDEVLVPAFTFPATANVVELAGARPVLVDVDPESFNLDPDRLEAALTPRTRAIMPVHLFGNPAEMEAILALAGKHGLAVIEDAAGAFGSRGRDRACGSFGAAGCFSFHPRKLITTGEGGLVVTGDPALADRLRRLRNHGLDAAGAFQAAGFNYRMTELAAALGLNQLPEVDRMLAERQELAAAYRSRLAGLPGLAFQRVAGDSLSAWQAFVVRIDGRENRPLVAELKRAGVEANIGTYAIHRLDYYARKYGYRPEDYPNADRLYRFCLALPFYNGIPAPDLEVSARALADRLAGPV